ncbi:MAG: polymerase delta subunit [Candidatus Parcubacteria bacterium]|jgi:hypothetical protein
MNSHHAVLFCSESPLSCTLDEYHEVPTQDQYRLAQFGIDDVRTLTQHAHRRPDSDATLRVILVATEFVTEEAQQALLKLIEEPPVSTRFVFIIPFGYSFLPTLESRFERQEAVGVLVENDIFVVFKAGGFAARLASIEQATKAKDHAWQQQIKRGLTAYLEHERFKLPQSVVSELEFVVRLLLTRGASNKFLLEHLALTLPA